MGPLLARLPVQLAAILGTTSILVVGSLVGAQQSRTSTLSVEAPLAIEATATLTPTRVPDPTAPATALLQPVPTDAPDRVDVPTPPTPPRPTPPRREATPQARPSRTPPARPTATPTAAPAPGQRSLAGTIEQVQAGQLAVRNLRGDLVQVQAAGGAIVKLDGKSSTLSALRRGDRVVVLGQPQRPGVLLAHAIAARRAAR